MDEKTPQINNRENLKTVRTYLSDMADTVRENEISVIKVALAEQNKHEREDLYRQAEGTPAKKIFWIIGGLFLVGVSIFGTYYIIQKKAKENIPAAIAKDETIISYDQNFSIDLKDGEVLSDKIKNQISENSKTDSSDGIKYISVVQDLNTIKEKLLVKEIFTRMGFMAPSSLVRSLSDNYMIGTYTKNNINVASNLFMIFQTKDYEYTYAGMLEWEGSLANDMFYLFNLNTKDNKLKLGERKWKDIIINNRDARVLYNEDDKPILYYLFANKDSLVISSNENTIKEIMTRLIIKNIKPL